ncbi:GNAT family N-acetyltransferase [Aureimonas sp. AU20]|uniref:GNAT family N-acetyltransferase n=1 Tax=Aureimonas sp. AU20 TaxID=1349819 RepID=UPI000721CC59|nr:GNAT family N-acetyltransferase [Aureimonas sp. AU20]ALN72322.1 hypothetical protein M673_06320 [Aureimonas sp. AU20]
MSETAGLPRPLWRAMAAADVPGAIAVADVVHPSFPEGPAMYLDRIALFPEGCLALETEAGAICGYAMAYPAALGAPPPLDTALGALEPGADALYLHDVALLPALRGRGLAEPAITGLLSLADRRSHPAMLVSVYGTAPYWRRFGFRPAGETIAPAKLASYGEGAVYMVRPAFVLGGGDEGAGASA